MPALPSAYFPNQALPSLQDLGESLDTDGAFTKKTNVVITSTYAGSGAVSIIASGGLFSAWPTVGYVYNVNRAEMMLYYTKTSSSQLEVKSTGRALDGTSAVAGQIGDVLEFVEARVLGLTINQMLSELKAVEESLNNVVLLTVTANISVSDSGKIHSNRTATGASSTRIATLPSINTYNEKLRYPLVIEDVLGLRVKANTVDYIRIEGRKSVIGGYIESIDVGASLLLFPISQNNWIGMYRGGEWNVDGTV